MVLVELGSKAPSTGPGATLMAPCTSTSSFGLVYAKKALVEVRMLGLDTPRRRQFWAVNPDLV